MSHLIRPIIDHLQLIVEHGGYTVLFLSSVLEGIPIIGPLIPGHTIIIFSGFLAKIGIFNIIIVTILAIAGATLGDVAGFLLGKRFGFSFIERLGKFFSLKEEYIEKAKKIVNEHTGKAIILGRINPVTRSLTPFTLGASGVHIKSFWLYDFIGVFIWVILSIAIGYIFGASYHIVALFVGRFIVIAFIISILIIIGYRFINKQFHIFAKYELFILILNIAGLYGFFRTLEDSLSSKSFMSALDVWINLFISTHTSSFWLSFMNIVTNIISPLSTSILALIGIIYFLYKKYWRYTLISALSFGGGLILNAFIKALVMRSRPVDAFIMESGYSFPSGHAVAATIFFILLVYFFARKIKSIIWREIFIVISACMIILVGFSRIYLGVHWLSDVVAGTSLGLFWCTLTILLVRYIGMIASIIRSRE